MTENKLENRPCVPCQGGIAPMSAADAHAILPAITGWKLDDGTSRISRSFTFRNFVQAQAFAVRVGEISEIENHHPEICYGWGFCTIVFYTHKIGGLHENDFIMAAKVNALHRNR